VWDFRYGQWKNYGRRTWGFNSVVESDSLNRLQKLIDSTGVSGLVKLGRGTWETGSQITLDDPITIEGTSISRLRGALIKRQGTIIKSTSTVSNDTTGTIGINWQGINLSRLNFEGNNRQNSNGVYAYLSNSPVGTTMGGYTLANVFATYNGRNGFNFESSDGNFFYNLESKHNGRYGIKLTSARGNGKIQVGGDGIGNVLLSGRARDNSYGGIQIYDTNQTIMIGVQSIRDSSGNLHTYSTGRTTVIGGDFEFNPPRAGGSPVTYNYKSDNDNQLTMMNTYVGSVHSQGTYTADTGTNTTTIVDAALPAMPNDYYVGFEADNTTRASGKIEITDYVASTNTLTLASSISGQTTGDTYIVTKRPNRGIWLDSLSSGLFIHNTGAQAAESLMVVTGYANAIFINPINFDPETDVKTIDGADFNFLKISNHDFGPANVELFANTKTTLQVNGNAASDSLVIRSKGSSGGIKLEGAIVELQPSAESANHIYFFRTAAGNANPQWRFYFDADSAITTTNRQYLQLSRTTGQKNAVSWSNSADSIKLVISTPVEISGNDGTERYISFLSSNKNPTPELLNNRVQLYGYDDKLWTQDDGGDTLNITPYKRSFTWNPANIVNGASQDTSVSLTGIAPGDVGSAGLSSIAATGWRIEVHSLSANNVNIRLTNNTGGDVNLASGTVKVRMWK